MKTRPEVLIATLGTEAQVVTLSLLELERLGFGVSEVVVVHTAAWTDKIRESIERLDAGTSPGGFADVRVVALPPITVESRGSQA